MISSPCATSFRRASGGRSSHATISGRISAHCTKCAPEGWHAVSVPSVLPTETGLRSSPSSPNPKSLFNNNLRLLPVVKKRGQNGGQRRGQNNLTESPANPRVGIAIMTPISRCNFLFGSSVAANRPNNPNRCVGFDKPNDEVH